MFGGRLACKNLSKIWRGRVKLVVEKQINSKRQHFQERSKDGLNLGKVEEE